MNVCVCVCVFVYACVSSKDWFTFCVEVIFITVCFHNFGVMIQANQLLVYVDASILVKREW